MTSNILRGLFVAAAAAGALGLAACGKTGKSDATAGRQATNAPASADTAQNAAAAAAAAAADAAKAAGDTTPPAEAGNSTTTTTTTESKHTETGPAKE